MADMDKYIFSKKVIYVGEAVENPRGQRRMIIKIENKGYESKNHFISYVRKFKDGWSKKVNCVKVYDFETWLISGPKKNEYYEKLK